MSEDRSTWASNGFKIAPFGKGRNAIQSAHTNDLVDALNMLGTITVIRGTEDKVLYADNGVIIQLKSSEVEASSSITVSESDGTPSVSDVTEIKFPAGTVTDDGGGVVTIAAVAPVQMLRLKSIQADYLTCRTWDGTTEGSTDILVAKSYKLRNAIVSAVIDGVTVTYAYPDTVTRTATISGSNETQVIVPRYLVNDLILGMTVGYTGVTSVTIIDLNLDGRAWSRA